jgi:HK97 family phage portal protein
MLIADGISTVPCKLMRKNRDTGRREEAVDHPLFDLLKYKPCGWMTSQQFRETLMLRATFSGQAFAFINWIDNSRKVSEIWPFDIGEVTVARRQDSRDRSPLYLVNGEEVPARNILHIRGPSWDARVGLDMVSLAREALGLAVATEKAHAGRFGNGIQTTGTYSVEGNLTTVQYNQLMHFIVQHYAGGANAGKPLLLDRNAKWTPQGMSGVDAEHLATRQHQDMLIARFFGVLPIMLGIADKTATYASSEQMFLAHCVHTVRPWHQRISEILNCWLLTPQERANGILLPLCRHRSIERRRQGPGRVLRQAVRGGGDHAEPDPRL